MRYIDANSRTVFTGTGGASSPIIYVINLPESPFDLAPIANRRASSIVTVAINNWGDSLTPWPAKALYREEPDFKGEAPETLAELIDEAIPAIEQTEGLTPTRRALCGYSLGGLFALYALTHASAFNACACLSGSVWYEGWVDHLRSLEFDAAGQFAFLSIGSKEKHAGPKPLHGVQDNMAECAAILREHGCETVFEVGPGGHLSLQRERFDAGITALDHFLAR